MKASLKTTILFVVTLVIGIAIGFEISEMILRNQFGKIENFRKPTGFISFFEDIIKPDANQKQIIEPLLLKYHTSLDAIGKNGFQRMNLTMDSLKSELRKVLTSEQIKRMDDKFREMDRIRSDHK